MISVTMFFSREKSQQLALNMHDTHLSKRSSFDEKTNTESNDVNIGSIGGPNCPPMLFVI